MIPEPPESNHQAAGNPYLSPDTESAARVDEAPGYRSLGQACAAGVRTWCMCGSVVFAALAGLDLLLKLSRQRFDLELLWPAALILLAGTVAAGLFGLALSAIGWWLARAETSRHGIVPSHDHTL